MKNYESYVKEKAVDKIDLAEIIISHEFLSRSLSIIIILKIIIN